MNIQLTIVVVAVLIISLLALILFISSKRTREKSKLAEPEVLPSASVSLESKPAEPISEPESALPLSKRLERTSLPLLGFFKRGRESKENERKFWEDFEETLLSADIGVKTSTFLIDQIKNRISKPLDPDQVKASFKELSLGLLSASQKPFEIPSDVRPYVIQIVGVNGVGKTTTIGKLAQWFTSKNKSVLIAAADTFRAAAIDQLKVWAERTHCEIVVGREGGDPGAVAFDAMSAAKARAKDVVLIDTAGRLHTKSNLMEELKKVERVMKKVIPEAPHEVWLVLDGTLGQNSIRQAEEFCKALPLTGIVLTKLDGTAKGGALFAIGHELNLPVRYIGVGESVNDLIPFDPNAFVTSLLEPLEV